MKLPAARRDGAVPPKILKTAAMAATYLAAVQQRSLAASLPPSEPRDACCEKYKQIFVLRNRNDKAAVDELIALFHSTGSVLLRHEVAYTMGQMQRIDAVPFLEGLLTDEAEDPITRHEAAEALGAIGSPDAMAVLREFSDHPEEILRESCWVALHMYDREAFLSAGVCV